MNPKKLDKHVLKLGRSQLEAPTITYIVPEEMWRLEVTYIYPDGEHEIKVLEGFKFDLSSIPRFLWGIIAPFELSISAPLIHDFLYRNRGVIPTKTYTKKEADLLFRKMMKEEGVRAWRCRAAYHAVRLFGRWKNS